MDRVRLAIVGCGNISPLNAHRYLHHPRCEVVAQCDPAVERAKRRAGEWEISPATHADYEAVLADASIDAVELLTPTWLHADQIVAALEAGKHVSCQGLVSFEHAATGAAQIVAGYGTCAEVSRGAAVPLEAEGEEVFLFAEHYAMNLVSAEQIAAKLESLYADGEFRRRVATAGFRNATDPTVSIAG